MSAPRPCQNCALILSCMSLTASHRTHHPSVLPHSEKPTFPSLEPGSLLRSTSPHCPAENPTGLFPSYMQINVTLRVFTSVTFNFLVLKKVWISFFDKRTLNIIKLGSSFKEGGENSWLLLLVNAVNTYWIACLSLLSLGISRILIFLIIFFSYKWHITLY